MATVDTFLLPTMPRNDAMGLGTSSTRPRLSRPRAIPAMVVDAERVGAAKRPSPLPGIEAALAMTGVTLRFVAAGSTSS